MYPSVRAYFPRFTAPLEGDVRFMYLDVLGKVTTGKGNLIDSVQAAQRLRGQFKGSPGTVASPAQVEAEWKMVKSRSDLKSQGGRAYAAITGLEISQETLATLVNDTLTQFEKFLKGYFSDYESWPADAQLGLLSMAWAMGPGFVPRWPKFTAACLQQDFVTAARECRMRETGNAGLKPRNDADQILFINAAVVTSSENGYQRSQLYYPKVLLAEPLQHVMPVGGISRR
jgi:hypothetical protein